MRFEAATWSKSARVKCEKPLRTLLGSIETELAETEMHLAMFYGVLDRATGTLRYANAGHPHAFRVTAGGSRERLVATCPPLGLTDAALVSGREIEWKKGEDLLVLFTDGIAEATSDTEEMFGEGRVLDIVSENGKAPASAIVDSVVRAVTRFAGPASDDRTILVLRV